MPKRRTKKRNIPKLHELASSTMTYLSTVPNVGDRKKMTPLAKEIEIEGGNPHMTRLRDLLTLGFMMKDVLKEYNGYFKEGILDEIERIDYSEIDMKKLLNTLIGLEINQKEVLKLIKKK